MKLPCKESITPRDLTHLAEHLGPPQLRKPLLADVIRIYGNRRKSIGEKSRMFKT